MEYGYYLLVYGYETEKDKPISIEDMKKHVYFETRDEDIIEKEKIGTDPMECVLSSIEGQISDQKFLAEMDAQYAKK